MQRAIEAPKDIVNTISLPEGDTLFRALIDNLPELAWTALADGHIDFYNRRWFEYTGTTFEEMEGWGWEKVHDPAMLPKVFERWTHSLATGEPFEMEFPLRGRDGVFRWFLTRVRPLRGADGQIVRWFGSNTNTDELRKLREDLKSASVREEAQRRMLEAIFREAPAGIALFTGPKLIIQFANQRARDLWQHGADGELVGLPLLDALPELRGQGFDDALLRVIETGEPFFANEVSATYVRDGERETGWFNFVYVRTAGERGEAGAAAFAFDVTAQVKTRTEAEAGRAALHALSERYQAAQTAGRIGIYDWEITRPPMHWSPEIYALLGLAPNAVEASAEAWAARVYEGDRARTWEAMREAIDKRERHLEIEMRVRLSSGALCWVRVTSHIFYDDAGTPTRLLGAVVDVQELKHTASVLAQERVILRESEERYAALFESSPLPLALTRLRDQTTVTVNQAFVDLFGYSKESIVGKTSMDLGLADPDASAQVAKMFHEQGSVRNFECKRRSATGHMLTLSLNLTRLAIAGEEHVLTTIEDVSIRKEQEAVLDLLAETSGALASSLAYEDTLARVAHLPISRFADMCSVYLRNDNGSISQVAAAGDHVDLLQGASRASEMIRTGATQLVQRMIDPRENPSGACDRQDVLRTSVASWSQIGVPLKERGQTMGAVFFTRTETRFPFEKRDLTIAEELGRRASFALENARLYEASTRAAEAERHAREKAEEATRLKDEFLATLSHELRTPLNAILGWSRMLQSGTAPPDMRQRAVDTIVRNAFAQNQLIEDLLDLSRIQSGKLRLNVDVVDPSTIVEAALDVVQPAAEAKGVRIQCVLDTDAGAIAGDASRLQQVFWNLLSNAVKFTPRNGRVHVTLTRAESNIAITIADTGAGIAAHFLPYVFDRFRQQDGAITRKAGGLGLGLAIVKSIVELHGGTVTAHSEGDGLGATFVVQIPIAPVRALPLAISRQGLSSPRPSTPAVSCPSSVAGLRILVVDDEEDARDLVRVVFEHCEANVQTAASAAEALTLVQSFRPDVIVSDIGMPVEDGYAFIRQLRNRTRDEGGATPAVALTAFARSEDRRRALLAGFQNHTAKPVDPQELLVVVANLVGRYALAIGVR